MRCKLAAGTALPFLCRSGFLSEYAFSFAVKIHSKSCTSLMRLKLNNLQNPRVHSPHTAIDTLYSQVGSLSCTVWSANALPVS